MLINWLNFLTTSFKSGVSGSKTLLTCAWVNGSLAEKSNASIITSVPLILLLIAVYLVSNLALRENMEEFKNSLSQIKDIEQIKWKKKTYIMREFQQNF